MAAQGERASGRPQKSGLWVADGERRRPFMRGIMIHSLMARGVSFEDAYRVSNAIRERLRGRTLVA
jgi:2-phosphoglycerate kinase